MPQAQDASSDSEAGRRRKTRRRVFFSCMMLGTYVACELVALGGLHLTYSWFSYATLRQNQQSIADGQQASQGAGEVIHPYFGWVQNPQVSAGGRIFGRSIPVNSLGFVDNEEAVVRASDEEFVLGIAGGSVAWQFSVYGEDLIRKTLEANPVVDGRRVRIVRMAQSGYKQPQQLMALNYVEVLGGHFDAVVNVDGYNEAALAVAENANSYTSVAYPRAWSARMLSAVDPRNFEAAERLLTLRAQRQSMARNVLASSLNWSPLVNLVWHLRDQSAQAALIDFGLEVSSRRNQSFVHNGPFDPDSTAADIDRSAVELWRRSSVQMHQICEAKGTCYLHVLQPNQYLPGSKRQLSELEQEKFFSPRMPTSQVIKRLYPVMRETGDDLRAQGVAFSDQTQLFVDERETVYCDYYCHYNERGNDLLTRAILKELEKLLNEKTASDPG